MKRIALLIMVMAIIAGTSGIAVAATGTVYLMDFPRSPEPNAGWGHASIILANGSQSTLTYYDNAKTIDDYGRLVAYCIEPAVILPDRTVLNQNDESYWDHYPSNQNRLLAPAQIKEFVGRILMYGYNGNTSLGWSIYNPSHLEDMANTIATQYLIWEVIVGDRDAAFNLVPAPYGTRNVMDMVRNEHPLRSKIMEHYNRITASVKDHVTLPSFLSSGVTDAQSYELSWDGSQYSVTLTDTNNVLRNFDYSFTYPGITYSITENRLTLSTPEPPIDVVVITASKPLQRGGMVIWDSPYQDIVHYNGNVADTVVGYGKLEVKRGRIQIEKSSDDPLQPDAEAFPLKDVVFEVYLKLTGSYENSMEATRDRITTGSEGNTITKDLPCGVYVVEEVLAAEGHAICDPFEVLISGDGQVYNHAVKNPLVMGKVTIEKKGELLTGADVIDGIHVLRYEACQLPNAVFDIIARSDVVTPDGKTRATAGTMVDTITTGIDGMAESKLLYLGDYFAVERAAPFGMILDETEHDFSLMYKNQTTPIVFLQMDITDERQKAEVSFYKSCERPVFDREGYNLYSSVIFGLFAREDIFAIDGSCAIPKDGLLELVKPDEYGKAIIKTDLPFGSYYIKEVCTAEYNVLNTAKYDFAFEYAGQGKAMVTIPVNEGKRIENRLQPIIKNGNGTLVTWRNGRTVPGGTFDNGMTYVEIDVEKARNEGYKFGIADSSPSNRYIGFDYFVKVEGNELVVYFNTCLISAGVSVKVYGEAPDKHDPSHHTTLTNGQELRIPLPSIPESSGNKAVNAAIEGNGNNRTLTITVDGIKYPNQPWNNNSSRDYELGGYKMNIAVQGNKVSGITVLESSGEDSGTPNPGASQIVYLFFHLDKGITHYDTWLK